MTIEFITPAGNSFEKLVETVRDELLELSHLNKKIVRAEVVLKEDEIIDPPENKICEIRLSIYGDDLLARLRTDKYRKSAKKALKELRMIVQSQLRLERESAESILGT